jgi:CBS domain containing-hemolysin-like protein
MKHVESASVRSGACPREIRMRRAKSAMQRCPALYAVVAAVLAAPAQASLFQGETLDAVADGIAWVVLVVAPIVLIVGFWLIHILPEKIAEKRKHPQAKAIQTLCLLSLFFGGMLWPIAWLWAYSRPVLYKMAYGTDVEEHAAEHDSEGGSDAAGLSDAERMRIKVVDRGGAAPVEHHTRERA